MNHKASAKCANGHTVEWGSCRGQVKRLLGGTKECGMKAFDQIYSDGSRTTVSFDDRRWNAVQCRSCHTVFTSTTCPQCGVEVPVTAFEKKGFLANLG